MYTATINQNGLILLNKKAREALGVKLGDRVVISISKKSATIKREPTDDEFFAQMDSIKSAKTKENIQKHAGQSADELFKLAMQKSTSGDKA